jgi:hypothetical protein
VKESILWQKKFYKSNVMVKGRDHEETIRSRERLEKLEARR